MLEIRKATGEDEEKIFRLIRELADAVGFAEQAPLIDIGIWSKTLEEDARLTRLGLSPRPGGR